MKKNNLKLISDNPFKSGNFKDKHLYKNFIDAISNDIKNIDIEDTPYVLAINGPWGSGKTSIMEEIKNEFNDEYLVAWFDSWKYNKYDAIGNAFIYRLFETLSVSDKLLASVKSQKPELLRKIFSITENIGGTIGTIGKVGTHLLDIGGTLKKPGLLNEYEKSFEEYINLLDF